MSSKIVVVTGASRGIGLEFARQYAQQDNTHVIAVVRNAANAKFLDPLVASGNVTVIEADMAKPEDFDGAAVKIGGVGGKVDVLINNAGTWVGAGATTTKDVTLSSPEEWTETFQVDTIAPVFFTKSLLPWLAKGQTRQVVNISSFLGSTEFHSATDGDFGYVSYSTAKSALNFATFKYHLYLKDQGYTFITLNPGFVQTDLTATQESKARLTPVESVRRMKSFIDRLTLAHSGRNYSLDGVDDPTLTS